VGSGSLHKAFDFTMKAFVGDHQAFDLFLVGKKFVKISG